MAIYKGATPINQLNLGGQAITSVYKGGTKIWPDDVGGAYYSTRWLRWNAANLFEKSNADISIVSEGSTGWKNFDWGAQFGFYGGGMGCTSMTGTTTNYTRNVHSSPAQNGTIGGVTNWNTTSNSPGLSGTVLSRTFFPAGETVPDVPLEEVYAHIDGNGTVVFSTLDGITVNRNSAGNYDVTFPRPMAKAVVMVSPQRNVTVGSSQNINTRVMSIVVDAGGTSSCNVRVQVGSIAYDSGFALWTALVPA